MKLAVSKEAAQWFMDEFELKKGDYIQFTVKLYGGIPTMHPSYFLGIQTGLNGEIAVNDEVKGLTFYFNKDDV